MGARTSRLGETQSQRVSARLRDVLLILPLDPGGITRNGFVACSLRDKEGSALRLDRPLLIDTGSGELHPDGHLFHTVCVNVQGFAWCSDPGY